ncbi:EAL domain-containing protein [Fodinisporobacter ferrooxydans]|uniref:EAL domain-containing protein n=1 Tax=Fodinisporobacter ferrooxydans TaxID=2901836 RepID=A0ABY4CS16_9BACL|nr:EAL domain-containing protein [Alicyclobacillaceae bacterium MYW30-H2]
MNSGSGYFRRTLSIRSQRIQERRSVEKLIELRGQIDELVLDKASVSEIYSLVCQRLVEIIPARLVWVGTKEPDGSVVLQAYTGAAAGMMEQVVHKGIMPRWDDSDFGRASVGNALRTGHTQFSNFIKGEEEQIRHWRELAELFDIRYSAAFPLKDCDQTFGVLVIYTNQSDGFLPGQIQVLERIGKRLAVAMLVSIERKRLEDSEERLRILLEHSKDIITLKDHEKRWIAMSRVAMDLLCLSNENFSVSSLEDVWKQKPASKANLQWIDEMDKIAWETRSPVKQELECKQGDEQYLVFDLVKIPVFNQDGSKKMMISIGHDITERQRIERQMVHDAQHDPLTGLPNRRALMERLPRLMEGVRQKQGMLALCLLDLDGFKEVNDSLGHHVGDQLLQEISMRLASMAGNGNLVARLGGDEFVIVLHQLRDTDQVQSIVSQVLQAIQKPFNFDPFSHDHLIQISGSMGVAFFPLHHEDPENLLRYADLAMYAAKARGGNCFKVFEEDWNTKTKQQLHIRKRMRKGIEKEEFRLYYQPVIHLRTGELLSVEALIRWQDPENGLLNPGEFLPMIAGTGWQVELDRWVLRTAAMQAKKWLLEHQPLAISINISRDYLLHADFLKDLRMILQTSPPSLSQYLIIEVLESVRQDDIAISLPVLQVCREIGIRIALDDFGTGVSSLVHLQRIPAAYIKIDRDFICRIMESNENRAIVTALAAFGQHAKRKVLGEGVETLELGKELLNLGCYWGQGFAIARPMPPEQVYHWYVNWQIPKEWRA